MDRSRTVRHAVAPVTISASELASIRNTISAPVLGSSSPSNADAVATTRQHADPRDRIRQMKERDLAKLKAKAESGALEGEQVQHLVHKLEMHVEETEAAKKFLSLERRADMVNTLNSQMTLKAARKEEEKAREHHQFLQVIANVDAAQRKAEEAVRQATLRRQHVQEELRHQMEERAHARMVQQEAKEQEAALIAAAAARAVEEAEAAALARKERARQLAQETMRANARFAERDAERKQKEADADRSVLMYQLAKAAREDELERLKKEEAEEAERVTAKLRAAQKKAMDNRSADDEARAKRVVEERILAERRAAAEEAALKRARLAEMKEAIDRQLDIKERRREEERRKDAEMAARIRAETEAALRKDLEKQAERRAAAAAAAAELMAQKARRQEAKAEAIKAPFIERQQLQLWEAAQKQVVEGFRETVKARMESKQAAAPLLQTIKRLPVSYEV